LPGFAVSLVHGVGEPAGTLFLFVTFTLVSSHLQHRVSQYRPHEIYLTALPHLGQNLVQVGFGRIDRDPSGSGVLRERYTSYKLANQSSFGSGQSICSGEISLPHIDAAHRVVEHNCRHRERKCEPFLLDATNIEIGAPLSHGNVMISRARANVSPLSPAARRSCSSNWLRAAAGTRRRP
jgi:hypothetical protein